MTTTTTTTTSAPTDSALGQLAPLVFVLVFPLLVIYGRTYLSEFAFHMISVASAALPWNWSSLYEHGPVVSKLKKKHPVRTRAEQLAARTDGRRPATDDASEGEKGLFYPGLVNISGTYCFMNSTMQALASLSYLQPHIDAIHAKAEAVDIPTPVVDALRDLLHGLNTPSSHYRSIRPVEMIAALSQPEPGRRIPLFSSREHQDAQELFQLVSEYIKKEATAVDREGARDLGFGSLASLSASSSTATVTTSVDVSKGVFDGLTANRRSCCECGYTEAVMHFPFDNWPLTVPRIASCRLEDCLMDYTRLETLTDCICRKCSMRATLRRLEQDAERLTAEAAKSSSVSQSKKKRLREVKRFALRLKTALEEGRIEEDIKGIKIEKVFSRASTKQAMVARPPPVLALHLNRSVHFGTYAAKNTARVHFPETLDLTPFTTSGMLSTSPSFPISSYLHMPSSIPSPTAAVAAAAAAATSLATQTHSLAPQPPRVLYRLAAVVCHYGQHSFGHYVCFRRRPRGLGHVGSPRPDEGFPAVAPGRGWLRASDDAVREVGIETVLQEGSGAFMLYYERVRNEDKLSVPAWSAHSRTVTDDDEDEDAGEIDGGQEKARTYRSQDVMKCESGEEAMEEMAETLVIKARVVRSVSLGRSDDFEGASEVEKGEDPDSEVRLSRSPSPRPAKPEHVELSAEASSPMPAVDEPPIGESADDRG